MCFSTHEFLLGIWILQHLIAPCLSIDMLKRPFRHLQILGQFQFCLMCMSYLMKIANGQDTDQNKHGVGGWGVGGVCFTWCLFALPACCWQWSAASEWGISFPDKLSHSFLSFFAEPETRPVALKNERKLFHQINRFFIKTLWRVKWITPRERTVIPKMVSYHVTTFYQIRNGHRIKWTQDKTQNTVWIYSGQITCLWQVPERFASFAV